MIWDQLAAKYDNLWVQKYSLSPTRKAVIEKILTINGIDKVVDIGCGTGQLLQDLSRKNNKLKLYGFDKSQQMITFAKAKNTGAKLFCGDITRDNILDSLEGSMDLVVCCHSFPYYQNKNDVIEKIDALIGDGGYAIFAQASINNLYDKFIMSIIEKTAEKADYLSRKDFLDLVLKKFVVIEEFQIHEKWFMPSICGFVLKKI